MKQMSFFLHVKVTLMILWNSLHTPRYKVHYNYFIRLRTALLQKFFVFFFYRVLWLSYLSFKDCCGLNQQPTP